MTLFQDNISPYISFVEGAAPGSPAATNFRLYYDSADHLLKWKNSAGTVTTIATGTSLTDPMTTRGDIIVRNSSNVTARLAVGAANKVLHSDGTDITWQSLVAADIPAMTTASADSTADVSLTADTIADATGVSVSLTAGTWTIWAEMTFSATTANYDYCLVDITDSSNNVVGEARGQVASNTPEAYCCFAVVTPGSTTTYKLRGQSGRTGNKILRYGQSTNVGTRMFALKVA